MLDGWISHPKADRDMFQNRLEGWVVIIETGRGSSLSDAMDGLRLSRAPRYAVSVGTMVVSP